MVKRGEKICVGSMGVSIVAMGLAGSFGIASVIDGNPQYHLITEILTWIWFISFIPICGFICSWIFDYPPGTRIRRGPQPSRIIVDPPEDDMVGIE